MIRRYPELLPQVIKIDVEGYEEVIDGLEGILQDDSVRGVFVEVHFAVLERQGLREAPVRIVRKLEAFGFKISWTDWSHIQAVRE